MSIVILFSLACLSFSATANRVDPLKVIKLTLGVSKATYLPLSTTRYIKNGRIIENYSISKLRYGFLPPKYDPNLDKNACSLGGWTAKGYEASEAEVLVFKNIQQKLVVFGFRGTEPTSFADWMRNFKISPVKSTIDKTTFVTHKGFKERYGFLASWFESEYREVPGDYTIIITGHSLGGAEATIAAVYAAGKLKRRPDAVVTYGSPLVGQQSFKDYYNHVVGCDRTLRISAKNDWFTAVPKFYGYIHVCEATKVDPQTRNFIKAHSLYNGYEKGIKNGHNANEVNLGCDKEFN